MEIFWTLANTLFLNVLAATFGASLLTAILALLRPYFTKRIPAPWLYALWLLPWAAMLLPAIWHLEVPAPWRIHQSAAPGIETRSASVHIPEATPSLGTSTSSLYPASPPTLAPVHVPDPIMPVESSAPLAPNASGRQIRYLGPLFPTIWLGVAILLALRNLLSYYTWRRSLQAFPMATHRHIDATLRESAEALQIHRLPIVRITSDLPYPAVTGLLRPIIVLPHAIASRANPDELRLVFLHELAHIKRGDLVVNALTHALLMVHWFNPFLYWARYELRTSQEQCCDAKVLQLNQHQSAANYGHLLLDLVEASRANTVPAPALSMISTHSQLKRRIEMLANPHNGRKLRSMPGAALLLVLTPLTLLSPSFASPEPTVANQSTPYPEAVPREEHATVSETPRPTEPPQLPQPLPLYTVQAPQSIERSLPLGRTEEQRFTAPVYSEDSTVNTFTLPHGRLTVEQATAPIPSVSSPSSALNTTEASRGSQAKFRDHDPAVHPRPQVPLHLEHDIPFWEATPSWSRDQAHSGNDIAVRKITSDTESFVEGGLYTVEGYYTLTTNEQAHLTLYATNGETEAVPNAGPRSILLSKGSGRFRLTARLKKMGSLHVSMYPAEGGEGFYNRYIVERVAEKVPDYLEVDAAKALTYHTPDPSIPAHHSETTFYHTAPPVADTSAPIVAAPETPAQEVQER